VELTEGMRRAHRAEASAELERREMLAVIAVLLDRLGGEVDITGEEFDAVRSGDWEVVSIPSMAKYSLGLKLHKPDTAAEVETPARPAIEAQ